MFTVLPAGWPECKHHRLGCQGLPHLPTGLVVSCQDEKSQHKNREKAMRFSGLAFLTFCKKKQSGSRRRQGEARLEQVSAVSASAPTTSPRAGWTDFHRRIGLTLYKIDPIVDGDLDEIIEALITPIKLNN